MKLSEWLSQPNSDGSRRKRIDLASSIGVTPSMITQYAEGRMWPGRERMEAIVKATAGEVTANDFLHPDQSQ